MRIAMLGHKRMPSREGGVEVVVTELATRMAALGHEVTVYSRKKHDAATSVGDIPNQDEYVYRGVWVKQVPTLDIRGLAAFTSSFAAMRAAIADKPDIIHVHAEGPCAAIPLAKRARISTVATIHGLDWQRAKWGKLASGYIKHGEKTAAKQADEVIVLSQAVQEYFQNVYDRKTTLIPNGIAAKKIRVADIIAKRWNLTKDSYILYLGRMVPEKGVHYLIEAFKALDTEKRLVLAGGASDSQEYFDKLKAQATNNPRIIFTNFVQGEVLEELFSNAALYVLPSDLEGMPMSLLEAMAYGCACLTSDIPECTDVLTDTGISFQRGSIVDLREKLQGLLADEMLLRELGARAQKHALSTYDWGSVVDQTLSLYKGIQ